MLRLTLMLDYPNVWFDLYIYGEVLVETLDDGSIVVRTRQPNEGWVTYPDVSRIEVCSIKPKEEPDETPSGS